MQENQTPPQERKEHGSLAARHPFYRTKMMHEQSLSSCFTHTLNLPGAHYISGVCVCISVNVGHDWQRSGSSDEPSVRLSGTNCLLLCFKKSKNNTENRFPEQGQSSSPPSSLLQR